MVRADGDPLGSATRGLAATAVAVPEPASPWLSAAVDGLPAPLCVLDAQGKILLVNRAWRRFALDNGGDPARSAEGTNYLAACGTPDDAEPPPACEGDDLGVLRGLRDVLAGARENFEVEYPCHAPNEERWYVMGVTRLEGFGPARALVTHLPVTQRRRAEQRQREVQKMEALGTLAGGIAHDFNNMLSAILGHTALALEELSDAHPARERLMHVQRAGQRARDLVHQILAFTRSQPREPLQQALAPLVEEVAALLRTSLGSGVSLHLALEEPAIEAVVDATEVEQVVLNLGMNAWQALAGAASAAHPLGAPSGRITIGLDASPPPRPPASTAGLPAVRDWAHLWVADNGPGMDEAVRERIFEPFFTTKPVGQGTGLGLAVVHGIVARLGGTVSVDTAPGRGCTFHIHLPRADRPVGARAKSSAASELARDAVPVSGPAGARVLVIDDDEVVGLMTEALLHRAGFEVERHTDPARAMARLQVDARPFHALLTDHSMPTMTGLEVAQTARRLCPALPVVIMSGFIADALVDGARQAGVRALVHKEHAFETLCPTLHEVLADPPRGGAGSMAAAQDSRVTPGSAQA